MNDIYKTHTTALPAEPVPCEARRMVTLGAGSVSTDRKQVEEPSDADNAVS